MAYDPPTPTLRNSSVLWRWTWASWILSCLPFCNILEYILFCLFNFGALFTLTICKKDNIINILWRILKILYVYILPDNVITLSNSRKKKLIFYWYYSKLLSQFAKNLLIYYVVFLSQKESFSIFLVKFCTAILHGHYFCILKLWILLCYMFILLF